MEKQRNSEAPMLQSTDGVVSPINGPKNASKSLNSPAVWVKVKEDVIVKDGIPVQKSSKGGNVSSTSSSYEDGGTNENSKYMSMEYHVCQTYQRSCPCHKNQIFKPHYNSAGQISGSTNSKSTDLSTSDWSPLDDGIQVTTENNNFSKEEVDDLMNKVLYHSRKKRLPVFEEICPKD